MKIRDVHLEEFWERESFGQTVKSKFPSLIPYVERTRVVFRLCLAFVRFLDSTGDGWTPFEWIRSVTLENKNKSHNTSCIFSLTLPLNFVFCGSPPSPLFSMSTFVFRFDLFSLPSSDLLNISLGFSPYSFTHVLL